MVAALRSEGLAFATTGTELTVELPNYEYGDLLIMALVTSFFADSLAVDTPELVSVPDGWEYTGAEIVDTTHRLRLLSRYVDDTDPTEVVLTRNPTPVTGPGTVFAARVYAFSGLQLVTGFFDSVASSVSYTTADGDAPAMDVMGDSRLVAMFYLGATASGSGGVDGYLPQTLDAIKVGAGAAFMLNLITSSSDIPVSNSTTRAPDAPGEYGFLGLVLVPRPASTVPGSAAGVRPGALMKLGCAEEYSAFITQTDPTTLDQVIVDAVGWSEIEWERVLDDISTASVTIPDEYRGVYCCVPLGGLRNWRFGLRIERNGCHVWSGPITGISRPVGSQGGMPELRLTASDMLARFKRRLASRTTRRFKNVDAGVVLATLINSSSRLTAPYDGFNLTCPIVTLGTGITREIVARDFEYAWDVIKEILDSSADGYVMNGLLHLFEPGTGWNYVDGVDQNILEGPIDYASGELIYGMFTESSYRERPGWSVSGMGQANTSYVPGDASGEMGFRRYWTAQDDTAAQTDGVLDIVDPNPLVRASDDAPVISDETFQRRATSIVSLRSSAPAVIEGGALAEDAPVSIDHLRPGTIWRVDIHDACFGQLLQASRLKRVSVKVTRNDGRLEESVSPTLYPVGYTEADL